MMIHEITEKVGRHKTRKRIGRGQGSGHGKTAGRGHKGAGSRSGYTRRAYFEGGQMSFVRRIPKRGFSNAAFRRHYHIVNLKMLEERFEDGAEVTAESLVAAGLIRDAKLPLKVLGDGEISRKLTITAAKFSAAARQKLEAAGCTINEVQKQKWTRQAAAAAKAGKKSADGSSE